MPHQKVHTREVVQHQLTSLSISAFDAQEDATRLSNRLAQLKKEEERSQKRIEDTRKRASEIMNARRRNGVGL